MGPETIWILIPLAGMGLGALGIWTKHRERETRLMSERDTEKAAQYAAQNERLEQRVQVLERIITEERTDLAQTIEDLRDKPLN